MKPVRDWQAVLYGRTLRADRWWRVRPQEVDRIWLDAVVTASTGGGHQLSGGPRYVLARQGRVTLVGGSARADLLSDTMNSDGSRPLYCFVGWLSRTPRPSVPTLVEFEHSWIPWAEEVYESWMTIDWQRHPSDLKEAHEPPQLAAPWDGHAASLVVTGAVPNRQSIVQTRGPKAVDFAERNHAWRTSLPRRQTSLLYLRLSACRMTQRAPSRMW